MGRVCWLVSSFVHSSVQNFTGKFSQAQVQKCHTENHRLDYSLSVVFTKFGKLTKSMKYDF